MPTIDNNSLLEKVRQELLPEHMRSKDTAETAKEIIKPQLSVIRGGADPRVTEQAIASHELEYDKVKHLLDDPF